MEPVGHAPGRPGAELLAGAVDCHVHACPHLNARSVDVLQAVEEAGAAGMRAPSGVLHELDHVAVACAADGQIEIIRHGVADHCHIHVVENAQLDELLLAAHELYAAALSQVHAALHLDELFRGHGNGHYSPR